MLTTRRAILGLALSLAMIGNSFGQSPTEPPRQNPGGAQQRSDTEQRDTDQAPPSIIKKLPAEDTQQKPTGDEEQGTQKQSEAWTLSDKIAAIAGIVALLQFFALVGTICVLVRTARRQLRAYIAIENAVADGDHPLPPRFNLPFTPQFSLRFKNCGQTPAYAGTYWIDVKVSQVPFDPRLIPVGKKTVSGKFDLPPTMCIYPAQLNGDKIASISAPEQAREFSEKKIAFLCSRTTRFYRCFPRKALA